jgi:hypothetical protein
MPIEPNGPIEPEERINTDDARAGKTGVGLRYVLGFSLVLTVVGMLVLLFVFGWRPATS